MGHDGNLYHFGVVLPGPLDVPASLAPLGAWGDDLLDRWDGTHLVRTVTSEDQTLPYVASSTGTIDHPTLCVGVEDAGFEATVRRALDSTFVHVPPSFDGLQSRDPVLRHLEEQYQGYRPVRYLDLLGSLVRCISAQQVNLRWAATTRRRLAEAFGEKLEAGNFFVYHLPAFRLASASPQDIRQLQFTTRKAEYIISAAEAVATGHLRLCDLEALSDEDVIRRLTSLRGIGLWTAEWILTRTLGRPRVVAGDLGVRKAVGHAYFGGRLPSEAEVRERTSGWGESAAVAQGLLLRALSSPSSTTVGTGHLIG